MPVTGIELSDPMLSQLRRKIAAVPGGRFVIDLWVPPIQRLVPGQDAVPISIDEEHLVFGTYDLVPSADKLHYVKWYSAHCIR